MERPLVIHFSTTSADGRIASSTRYSILSCIFDKTRLYVLRGSVNAVMVGAGTVEADNPRLVRRIGQARPYYRIVVDGRLRLTPDYRVFDTNEAPTILVTSSDAPPEKLTRFRDAGVEIIRAGRGPRLNLREALWVLLESYGVRSILVEGGGILAWSLYRERVVDEYRVTITPVIFAAGRGVIEDPEHRGFASWEESPRLEMRCHELCPCGHCIHIVYRVRDARGVPAAEPPRPCLGSVIVEKVYGVIQSRAPT